MLKVSFKEGFKKVQKFNERATVVTLTGEVIIPSWEMFPNKIQRWMFDEQNTVDVEDTISLLKIKAVGKSVKAEEDTDNPVLAERIAEARAKLKIYRFMYKLCKKMLRYYFTSMYGNAEVGRVLESHTEPQKDCIWVAGRKYMGLMIKESHHLGQLLEEA